MAEGPKWGLQQFCSLYTFTVIGGVGDLSMVRRCTATRAAYPHQGHLGISYSQLQIQIDIQIQTQTKSKSKSISISESKPQSKSKSNRAFDEFKIRWIPPVPLVYPQPAGFFFLGVFADGKKPSGSACIDASRLIFQSAVSFQIRLFFCIPAVKPSEFTECTLNVLTGWFLTSVEVDN